ncbi:MAG: DUF2274 domain-containing protein, partial [Pseudomonadota bacterium]
ASSPWHASTNPRNYIRFWYITVGLDRSALTLKLGPIPDRTPVKLSVALPPDVHASLGLYAELHAAEHGGEPHASELAALMIERFLDSDAGFKRARKAAPKDGQLKSAT